MTHTVKELRELIQHHEHLFDSKMINDFKICYDFSPDEEMVEEKFFNKFSQKVALASEPTKTVDYPEAIYPGNKKFSDFIGLKEVAQSRGGAQKYPHYFHIDFDQFNLPEESLVRFQALLNAGDVSIDEKNGLKSLLGKRISKAQTVLMGGQTYEVTHELKAQGIPDRFLCCEVKPQSGQGPNIIVAYHFEPKGLHHSQSLKKSATVCKSSFFAPPVSRLVSQAIAPAATV